MENNTYREQSDQCPSKADEPCWTYKNVEFGPEGISYRKWRKWVTVPYAEIVQAYRQVEEAKANICCGRAVFEIHRVILVTKDGKKQAVEMPDRETGVALLDRLAKRNPGIVIGIKNQVKGANQ